METYSRKCSSSNWLSHPRKIFLVTEDIKNRIPGTVGRKGLYYYVFVVNFRGENKFFVEFWNNIFTTQICRENRNVCGSTVGKFCRIIINVKSRLFNCIYLFSCFSCIESWTDIILFPFLFVPETLLLIFVFPSLHRSTDHKFSFGKCM